jgi:hypothetical protein
MVGAQTPVRYTFLLKRHLWSPRKICFGTEVGAELNPAAKPEVPLPVTNLTLGCVPVWAEGKQPKETVTFPAHTQVNRGLQ